MKAKRNIGQCGKLNLVKIISFLISIIYTFTMAISADYLNIFDRSNGAENGQQRDNA